MQYEGSEKPFCPHCWSTPKVVWICLWQIVPPKFHWKPGTFPRASHQVSHTNLQISIQVPTKDTNISKKHSHSHCPGHVCISLALISTSCDAPPSPTRVTAMVSWCHETSPCQRDLHIPWIFVTWTTGINYTKLQNTFVQRSNVLGSGQFDAPGRHFMSNSALIVSYGINVAIWRWSQFFTASWGSTWWREAIGFGNSF